MTAQPVQPPPADHRLKVVPSLPGRDPGRSPEVAGGAVFELHRGGKIEMRPRSPLRDHHDLSLAYTPGVAEVSLAIARDPALADVYTARANTVAIVTDGTAVLGLGDIGPAAALPVMEGKAVLFKHFGGIDAIPVCLATTEVTEIVETVARLAPTFGGINLEDISAPRCFEVERVLQDRLAIPVFHDDQHGTAIVALAALLNAARVVDRPLGSLRVAVSGAGAAGWAVTKILQRAGVRDLVVCDSQGVLDARRASQAGPAGLPPHKRDLAATTNPRGVTGSLGAALAGADVFIGVSGGTVAPDQLATMAPGAIIFALANPEPEVHPDLAARYAAVVATGRSDYPNQINNVLAFPGVFRGALDVRAGRVTEGMKLAAARALAGVLEAPTAGEIVPSVFDERVVPAVAAAVARAAHADGVARAQP